MSDFLGLGLIIKEQKEKLDWQENIIKACDTTMNELRAKIERLTDENRKMNATLSKDAIQIFELEAENERLRSFLKEIMPILENYPFRWPESAAKQLLADQGKG